MKENTSKKLNYYRLEYPFINISFINSGMSYDYNNREFSGKYSYGGILFSPSSSSSSSSPSTSPPSSPYAVHQVIETSNRLNPFKPGAAAIARENLKKLKTPPNHKYVACSGFTIGCGDYRDSVGCSPCNDNQMSAGETTWHGTATPY